MPVRQGTHHHVKVYRPIGMRYAEASGPTLLATVTQAQAAFAQEFKYEPRQDETVIEVVGVTGLWYVTVMEVKNE